MEGSNDGFWNVRLVEVAGAGLPLPPAQQNIREPAAVVSPFPLHGKTGFAGDPGQGGVVVFVRILGVDRLTRVEADLVVADAHRLRVAADEVHLDAADLLVEKGEVGELREVEVAAELAV